MFRTVKIYFLLFLFFATLGQRVYAVSDMEKLGETYIENWIDFYPSEAFTYGNTGAAWEFENFSEARVKNWLNYNTELYQQLVSFDSDLSIDQAINLRVLRRQALMELERWQYDRVLENQAIYYAELISQALTYVLVRDQFTPEKKKDILLARLKGVQSLSELGLDLLKNGSQQRTRRAVKILRQSVDFYETNLPDLAAEWTKGKETDEVNQQIRLSGEAIKKLIKHVNEQVLPVASIPDKFESADYARKLKIYTDSDLSPEQLRQSALKDINEVRKIMHSMASSWWQGKYPQKQLPGGDNELLQAAMIAMENDRENNREDFLDFFIKLTNEAEAFVIKHELATVPLPRTLKVALSPDHFSGAAYGGVYPTGPFDPDAITLFYLPSIPDDSPEDQKIGFYRSFNTHFNTMIVAHEMLPGHYLQYKVGVSTAPAARSLFANGVYVEGWGTFSEELMLNAGWGAGEKMTRLAHLRKRLENATRAYVSVMVHYEGWDKQQLIDFSTRRGLLAPQFAINLWNRVMNSPLQITNYFLGFHAFRELWAEQKARLGDDFVTRDFVDGILQAGPISIDALGETLK
ncbi:MAG: DUF885 family protein [Gammaproteobacteria bacterium]|nr:DUF885 family protein [Gammaproteobacteria bacterium]